MPYRKEIIEYPKREGRARRDWALADGNCQGIEAGFSGHPDYRRREVDASVIELFALKEETVRIITKKRLERDRFTSPSIGNEPTTRLTYLDGFQPLHRP